VEDTEEVTIKASEESDDAGQPETERVADSEPEIK
jgi:hypothetical protein